MESDWIFQLMKRCQKSGTLLVLDECFTDFLEEEQCYTALPFLRDFPGTIILKAFTKMYAMAGIRLGYALCADENRIRQISGRPGLERIHPCVPLRRCSADLSGTLRKRPNGLWPKNGYFCRKSLLLWDYWCMTEKPIICFFGRRWADLPQRLERLGILIRSCGNYRGLDDSYCRIAVKSRKDNIRLLDGIRQILQTKKEGSESKWQRQL